MDISVEFTFDASFRAATYIFFHTRPPFFKSVLGRCKHVFSNENKTTHSIAVTQVHSHATEWSEETAFSLPKTSFPTLLAGFRLDGDYVNRICHISSGNYCSQWRRSGPPQREVKYISPFHNKIVCHFYLIDSQRPSFNIWGDIFLVENICTFGDPRFN